MRLRFVFLLIMRLVAWLRLSRREETWNTAEILILHHQLTALQRRQPRRSKTELGGPALAMRKWLWPNFGGSGADSGPEPPQPDH
jgi:hypothetical protein